MFVETHSLLIGNITMKKTEKVSVLRAYTLAGWWKQCTHKEHHGDIQATMKWKPGGTLEKDLRVLFRLVHSRMTPVGTSKLKPDVMIGR
jgi:hypothetical protein